jgi:hypothetical protein
MAQGEFKLPETKQLSGLQGALKARRDDFLRAGICNMLTPADKEYEEMNLIELQKKSSAELRDMYNELADRQVKRFASRVEAEKRTADALKESGQWDGALPGAKEGKAAAAGSPSLGKAGKAAKKAAAAAPAPKGKGKDAPAASKAGKAAKKAGKAAKTAAAPRENLHAGRPAANRVFRATDGKGVTYKVRETSQRGKLFAFIKDAGAKGVDHESCEQQFLDDEDMNVRAHLGILLKVGLIEVVK